MQVRAGQPSHEPLKWQEREQALAAVLASSAGHARSQVCQEVVQWLLLLRTGS